MPDGKKKRPRKRQRRSGVPSQVGELETHPKREEEDEVHGNEAGEVPEGKEDAVEEVDPRRHGRDVYMRDNPEDPKPTLSFYERTNPHKPSALTALHGGTPRRYTVSVAIPGSIILNAQSPELQSRLAGQIARSCAIFNIDEIVIFDEGVEVERSNVLPSTRHPSVQQPGQIENEGPFDPNAFLARILQYVETPQYLRKMLFPMHRDLRMAGILAPLDCPHHLRFEEDSQYREGVCVATPHWAHDKSDKNSIWVHTGLTNPIPCSIKGKQGFESVPLHARVTVKMPKAGKKTGQIVSPREPTEESGLYWGYTTRLCSSLSQAISATCWNEPYDLVVGTSERGASLTQVTQGATKGSSPSPLHPFKHALLVFGGLSGLEVAVERDTNINLAADEASELFDLWLNVVEGQGSRTVRTEEALLITLARLKTTLERFGQR